MVSPELIRCGRQALAAVVREAATGAPLVKCQLVASSFYEALKHELAHTTLMDVAERDVLMATTIQCLRTARAALSPSAMVEEFERAVIMLEEHRPASRPFLRIIEGGRSSKPPLARPARHLRTL